MKSFLPFLTIVLLLFSGCTEEADSSAALSEFKQKFDYFSIDAEEVYSLPAGLTVNDYTTDKVEANGTYTELVYEFKLMNDSCSFFIQNSLTRFKDSNDMKVGWDFGEAAHWAGVANKNVRKENFAVYRDPNSYKVGDYSEYSELDAGNNAIVALHVRIKNVLIYYTYLIEQSRKEKLMTELLERVREIDKKLE